MFDYSGIGIERWNEFNHEMICAASSKKPAIWDGEES